MRLANAYRAAGANCGSGGVFGPAPALTWSASLASAALVHSQDMVTANFFSHTGSNGSTFDQRITAAGYAWQTAGENIAAGYPGLSQVMAGWMASPGHCANLMNPSFTQMGLACVNGTSANPYGTYWTQDFAKPR